MEERVLKLSFGGLAALIGHYIENFNTGLVWLLLFFEIGDYITGLVSARMHGKLESGQAAKGFIKKICYFFLVGVGFGVDFIIIEVENMSGLGASINHPAFFGILSVGYLLSTEAISIVENMTEMGVEVPFLTKLIKKLRRKISNVGNTNTDNEVTNKVTNNKEKQKDG